MARAVWLNHAPHACLGGPRRADRAHTGAPRGTRSGELLDGLAASVGDRSLIYEFATIRKQEADSGKLAGGPDQGRLFSGPESDELITGFTIIRDQEPLDDVNDWANAVIQLLEDDAGSR